jgi:cysteinyl-tRNA synthetase
VLSRFPAEVVRFFLTNCHYRSPLDFSDTSLAESETALLRLYSTLHHLKELLGPAPDLLPPAPPDFTPANLTPEELGRLNSLRDRFREALDDDLNTAQALGYLFEAVRFTNRLLEAPSTDPPYLAFLSRVRHDLLDLGRVLNLLQADPGEMVTTLRQKAADLKIAPAEIQRLIDERTQARKNKDWSRADAIRQQLVDLDILLEDTPQGTIWRVKS